MKATFLSMLMCSCALAFGQGRNTHQTAIVIDDVAALMKAQASPQQVIKRFGQATEEIITPEYVTLQYKTAGILQLFRFNKERKLDDFQYINETRDVPDQLSYTDVKQARSSTSKDEIREQLGNPLRVAMAGNKEVWYYRYQKKGAPEKMLTITFDDIATGKIKSYDYYADYNNSIIVKADIVNALVKGVSSLKDIEEQLGQPSKIAMTKKGEDWYYTSKNTTLIVYFDASSRLNDYRYLRKAD